MKKLSVVGYNDKEYCFEISDGVVDEELGVDLPELGARIGEKFDRYFLRPKQLHESLFLALKEITRLQGLIDEHNAKFARLHYDLSEYTGEDFLIEDKPTEGKQDV